MPPALQIDVPPEQAQQILEKRRELGPYIFREAQVVCVCVACFGVCSVHWLCPCADVCVQPTVEVLARVSGAQKRDPQGSAPPSAAGEKDQTHSPGEATEEEGRGGWREQESSGKDTPMEVKDVGVGGNLPQSAFFFFFFKQELERPQSGYSEEEETGDEEGRSEERQLKMQNSKVSATPIKSVRSSLLFITQSWRHVCVCGTWWAGTNWVISSAKNTYVATTIKSITVWIQTRPQHIQA